jgi:Arm DNA-binding domain
VKIHLTDRKLKALRRASKRYDFMDSDVPGFGVRVSEVGQKTFILIARYPGSKNPTRRALGEYPSLSLEKARERARDWRDLRFARELIPRLRRTARGA